METASMLRSTTTILFTGDCIGDVARMATSIISNKRTVMFADLSLNQYIFKKVLGNIKADTTIYREICYTRDVEFSESHWKEYDIVFLCCDENVSVEQLNIPIDKVYVSVGISKGSMFTLNQIMKTPLLSSKEQYYLVLRASEKQAKKYRVDQTVKIISCEKLPEKIFYVPITERDIEGELMLDYGTVTLDYLSNDMGVLLGQIKKTVKL